MAKLMGYAQESHEAEMLKRVSRDAAAQQDLPVWSSDFFDSPAELLKQMRQEAPEMICMDIVPRNTIGATEAMRRSCPKAQLLLIADVSISPLLYLRPSIRASALLLKPYTDVEAHKAFTELMAEMQAEREREDDECFFVETKQRRRQVPYASVLYFEARERRICLYTEREMIAFYDTLEKMAQRLPAAFLRCHKSFIVNTRYIREILYAENEIRLWNDTRIPVSRSYRSDVKAWRT